MKKVLVSMMLVCSAWVMLSGCASPEERAARAAEQAAKVTAALKARDYKISVDRMFPMKGSSKD